VPGERWNDLLNATSTWGNGAELDRVSVQDYVRYEDSGTLALMRYGRLFETLAEGCRLACKAAVVTDRPWRPGDPARDYARTLPQRG